jgi:anthranilate phosphoribosyltransferase
MNDVVPGWYGAVMAELLARRDLGPPSMRQVMEDLVNGQCGEIETTALLIALRAKGESSVELAAAAQVLRERMIPFETGRDGVLDTCGTGGDEAGTFNISTAAAFVAAACGVPVVKHGNRAFSSTSGSSEVLEALGVALPSDPTSARRCLDSAGIAFCSAPVFHPAMRHLAPLRQRLRVRTLFNCLGPLANPARANYQVIGVGRKDSLDPMAGALARLGIRRAFLVTGSDGLDEVTLGGATFVREVRDNQVTTYEWHPADFGLEGCALHELGAANPAASAEIIRKIFNGLEGPASRIVMANTAAALLAAGRVTTLREGVDRAAAAMRDGLPLKVLNRLVAVSKLSDDGGHLHN